MDNIKASYEICYRVYQQDEKLFSVIRRYFTKHGSNANDRKVVSKICVSYFHHQLLLNKVISDSFSEVRSNEMYILGIALADVFYAKVDDMETILNSTYALLKLNKSNLSNSMVERLITIVKKSNCLLPSSVKEGTKLYMSLQYNVPMWVIDLWYRHYGKATADHLIVHTTKAQSKSLRINSLKTNMLSVLENGRKELVPGASMTGTSVVYHTNKDFKSLSLVEQGWLIPLDEGTNHLVNKLHLKRQTILDLDFNGNKTFLALAESSKDKCEITHYVAKEELRFKSDGLKNRYGFKNIESDGGSLAHMAAVVSYQKDLVLVEPRSTNFNSIRENPDFFIHLKQENLDDIIAGEKELLEEASSYVLKGGQLVYLVQTANNKEGTLLIKSFLTNHKDFKLVEERQTLELDMRKTDCYFAILKRVGK